MLGIFVSQIYGNESLLYKLPAKIFYLNPSRPLLNFNLPTFHAHELHNFDGTVIATNLETYFLLSKLNVKKKIFYMRELEWTKTPEFFENTIDNYTNPGIIYVSATPFIQEQVKKAWGTDSLLIREVEFDKIANL